MIRVEQAGQLEMKMLLPHGAWAQIESACENYLVVDNGRPFAAVAFIAGDAVCSYKYVCLMFLHPPTITQLKWLRRAFAQERSMFLARCFDERAFRFAEFLGFRRVLGDVVMRERL